MRGRTGAYVVALAACAAAARRRRRPPRAAGTAGAPRRRLHRPRSPRRRRPRCRRSPRACASRGSQCVTGCAALAARPAPGSLLRVRGRSMRRADEVVFLGADGDRRTTSPRRPCKRRATPSTCASRSARRPAPVVIVDRDGVASAAAPAPLAVEAAGPSARAPAVHVDVQAPRAYFDAARPVKRLLRRARQRSRSAVVVELVREADGAVIARWTPGEVAPETPQTVQWDGLAGGRVQREGRYRFRVSAHRRRRRCAPPARSRPRRSRACRPTRSSSCATSSRSAARTATARSGAAFGGGRGHQGHDVFADCGTPLVAARGGIVKFKPVPRPRRALPRHRRRADRRRLRLHAPARRGAASPRASACAPAS